LILIDEKIKTQSRKRTTVEASVKKCEDILDKLTFIFNEFNGIVNPFLKNKEEAMKIIDAFTAWIIIWNKYPCDIKRNMILASSIILKLEPEKFDNYVLHDL
jgi:hypothetical protein